MYLEKKIKYIVSEQNTQTFDIIAYEILLSIV